MTGRAPLPLVASALLAGAEGLALVTFGVLEVAAFTGGRLTMGATTAAFFLGYGAALLLCAWGLTRLRSWARAPVLLAQLVQLGLAWSFRQGETWWVAVLLAVVALATALGILNPASTAAMAGTPDPGDPS